MMIIICNSLSDLLCVFSGISTGKSSTGYVSNFQVYTGREGGSSEKGLAHRIVMDLAGPDSQRINLSIAFYLMFLSAIEPEKLRF